MGELVGDGDDLLALLAQCRHRDPGEDREHHDLENLVVGHRLDDRARHHVGDELLERERGDLEVGGGTGLGQRQVEVVARAQQVDHDEAKRERDQRGGEEPGHRLEPDALAYLSRFLRQERGRGIQSGDVCSEARRNLARAARSATAIEKTRAASDAGER